jgi:hypothetical protein
VQYDLKLGRRPYWIPVPLLEWDVTNEVDLNRVYCPSLPLGLEETASAFVLEESNTGEGFSAFGYRSFPEHADVVPADGGCGRQVVLTEPLLGHSRIGQQFDGRI